MQNLCNFFLKNPIIYALLCGEKLSRKVHLWRKNDKCEVWECLVKCFSHREFMGENRLENITQSPQWRLPNADSVPPSTNHCCPILTQKTASSSRNAQWSQLDIVCITHWKFPMSPLTAKCSWGSLLYLFSPTFIHHNILLSTVQDHWQQLIG